MGARGQPGNLAGHLAGRNAGCAHRSTGAARRVRPSLLHPRNRGFAGAGHSARLPAHGLPGERCRARTALGPRHTERRCRHTGLPRGRLLHPRHGRLTRAGRRAGLAAHGLTGNRGRLSLPTLGCGAWSAHGPRLWMLSLVLRRIGIARGPREPRLRRRGRPLRRAARGLVLAGTGLLHLVAPGHHRYRAGRHGR